MKRKPIRVNWDELEAAFDNQSSDLVYYLDLVTGHVILDGEGEDPGDADDPAWTGGESADDGTRAYVEPLATETKVEWIRRYVADIARRLKVVGMINVQLAVKGETVYVIEANPRASRTVPFVAKATGVPVANVGTKLMLGERLAAFREAGVLEAERTGREVYLRINRPLLEQTLSTVLDYVRTES